MHKCFFVSITYLCLVFSTSSFGQEQYLVTTGRVLIEVENQISQNQALQSLFQRANSDFICQENYCSIHGHIESSPCQGTGKTNTHKSIVLPILNNPQLQQYYDSIEELEEEFSEESVLASSEEIFDFSPLFKLGQTRRNIRRRVRTFLQNYNQIVQAERNSLTNEHNAKLEEQAKKQTTKATIALSCCDFQCHRSCFRNLCSEYNKCPSCKEPFTQAKIKKYKKNFVPNKNRKDKCWVCLDTLKTKHNIKKRKAEECRLVQRAKKR